MAGIDLRGMPMSDMLDVTHHLMIEDLIPHATVQVSDDRVELYSRAKIRADVENMLDGVVTSNSIADADPETWGTGVEQQHAMAAFMAQVGPPAGGGPT